MYSAFTTWGTLNSRRAASPLVRLVEGGEMLLATSRAPPPLNCDKMEQNRSVICMAIKANAYGRRKNLARHRDEFRGP
ncbi:hypothetical protein TNCV_250211 [Trichonephila clavipes]|nr:hypothetical protein TNCV_250211 [Trichonephila clavipes]